MNRFLPLLMLTGLLFGQDVLILKSGESYKGSYVKKVDELIVFQVEGENHSTPFPISDVETIQTDEWGVLTYPFKIPRKSLGRGGKFCCSCVTVLAILLYDAWNQWSKYGMIGLEK